MAWQQCTVAFEFQNYFILTMEQDISLCDLPKDVIKLIISFCPCPQWFTLCKQMKPLALQVISPLEYRNRPLLIQG
jgi:hypothetical protein